MLRWMRVACRPGRTAGLIAQLTSSRHRVADPDVDGTTPSRSSARRLVCHPPPVEPVDEHFARSVEQLSTPDRPADGPARERLEALFEAQAESRHLDFAARYLQQQGAGFYTIGSAGHESNAALGLLSRTTDPALLHYRSGAFFAARAPLDGSVDPVRETLRSLTGSAADPMSGGRHKVIGHPKLHIIPQTSTIASHLPRAVGLGFALGLARQLE